MSYHDFLHKIKKDKIKIIFELGSRDLIDSIQLLNYYNNNVNIYAFECNPECLIECKKNFENLDAKNKEKIVLVEKAVSLDNGEITFYPFDLTKYDNMGSSSLLKIDFSTRNADDPDYNIENPQKEIKVDGTRLDTFIDSNNIQNIDLLCIDLQGYELNAIKSLGDKLHNVKCIITECSISSTYVNGASFVELYEYLKSYGFSYVLSNKFGVNFPDLNLTGFSEFDALFINNSIYF